MTGDFQRFDPDNLVKTVIAVPLLRQIESDSVTPLFVIIVVNNRYVKGRESAKRRIFELVNNAISLISDNPDQGVNESKSNTSPQYVYAKLQGKVIRAVVEADQAEAVDHRSIHHVWPDFIIRPQLWRSVPTVKGDACRRSFATTGKGILWAVLDSGIDASHSHFGKYANLRELPTPVQHMDFTSDPPTVVDVKDLTDSYGHGTHVAGIIAGELDSAATGVAIVRERDSIGKISYRTRPTPEMIGVAPECKLVSYKVITGEAGEPVSNVIAAIEKIQEINNFGREIIIHGANLSLGYDFEANWFACGQSPVCMEVDRLVRSGVVVVIAAGNTGKGFALTINDPGNAELAITVGSTHREKPHTYGVSYFSSKGPTGDGRRKPDLLAPGERIVSCGAGPDLMTYKQKAGMTANHAAYYIERSGTSMAAPHVSGIIAGLLSVRSEFVGKPEEIKKLLLENCTDLRREPGFQGRGLVDMMRTIQSI